MAQPLLIWSEALLEYNFGAKHPFDPVRWDLTHKLADRLGVLDHYRQLQPTQVCDETLLQVHTAAYVHAVQRAQPDQNASLKARIYGLGTEDNPIFGRMHEATALIVGGSVAAAKAIADGTTTRAVNFTGGLHHAMPAAASGFCVYNDAALAIRALLSSGVDRVAYIDVDVHHGDGVQQMFYDDPRVLTVSIHESPQSLWPGTGWATECGIDSGEGTAINLPVPAGTADGDWLKAFHAVIPSAVRAFKPQVVVSQHGADSHREDPLADLNITVDGQRAAQLAIRDLANELCGGRWLALGGGGYSLVRVVPRTWTHLLAVVADQDIALDTAIPTGWAADVRQISGGRFANFSEIPARMRDLDSAIEIQKWNGLGENVIDREILRTRRETFPYLGLDPKDPRD